MSDDTKSLDDISKEFKDAVGHYPHDVKQVLAYCKQKNYPYKFAEINKWWPGRENKESKQQAKPVNADEYKEENASGEKAKTDNSGGATEEKPNTEAPASTEKKEEAAASPEEAAKPTEEAAPQEEEEEEEEEEN